MQLFEAVIAALRARAEEARSAAEARAAAIRAAAEAYVAAVERDRLRELATKLELEVNGTEWDGPSAAAAAIALRAVVEELPELAPVPLPSSTSSAETPPPAGATQVSRPMLEVYEASPEAKALLEEVRRTEFDSMPLPELRAAVAEFAARARLLQQRGENAEDLPGRVVRRLTAIVAERNITGIFGLRRSDQADWQEVVARARADRERAEANSRSLTHKLEIPESVRRSADETDVEPASGDAPLALPHLCELARERRVVLLGGVVRQEKLERLSARLGFEPEWLDTKRNGTVAIGALAVRVRDGRVGALVLLDGLVGHQHVEPVLRAARAGNVPVSYGDKAGKASLDAALRELEEQLQQRSGNGSA